MTIKYKHLFSIIKYKFHLSPGWKEQGRKKFILGLAVFLVLFFALLINSQFFYSHFFKKPELAPKPAPALQIVIQKPEPTHIEKIEHPFSAAEIAQEKYQQVMERLHQDGDREITNSTRVSEAVLALRHILAQFPVYPSAREALAALLIKQGNLQEANRIVAMGLVQNPSYLPYLKLRLYILINQGNTNQAMLLIKNTPELRGYIEQHS